MRGIFGTNKERERERVQDAGENFIMRSVIFLLFERGHSF
jgi:hypothetical protein